MADQLKFYIDGQWVDPIGTETLDVINPATEQPIGKIALGNAEDVNRAVAAAKAAFESFSQTTKQQRVELMQNIIGVYKERIGEIANIISEEMGAPAKLANAAQAPSGLGHFMTILKVLENFEFEEDIRDARIIREPAGVCGFITPWNCPINQIAC